MEISRGMYRRWDGEVVFVHAVIEDLVSFSSCDGKAHVESVVSFKSQENMMAGDMVIGIPDESWVPRYRRVLRWLPTTKLE